MKLRAEGKIMLLRFRVTNHRSIRDTVELSMTASNFSASQASGGNWAAVTNRVAGIFGANASGKTTILNAINFAQRAVKNSAKWDDESPFPYHPFLLDDSSRNEPSAYEIDFTADGIRYSYGFESNAAGVVSEWLHSFPSGRKRILFERDPSGSIEFGRNLRGENQRISRLVGKQGLFLSVAAGVGHKDLSPIWRSLGRGFNYIPFSDQRQSIRIKSIRNWIEDDKVRRQAESLLRFADLGISRISAERTEMDPTQISIMRNIMTATFADEQPSFLTDDAEWQEMIDEQRKEIGFWHSTENGAEYRLDISKESAGTVSWLSLALPALRAIESGGVFAVDEIDASLHPQLVAALIELFKSDEFNQTGAQLLFASHDTSLMGHLSGSALGQEDVWFTEKGPSGATDLYPLTDFPHKRDYNVERRYLSGRYGSVPQISWSEFRAALEVGS
ncbi:ATP/GTP-binding protein [Kitasatospora purpeofusca]|uniref:AAA family ATPase n=1 Tax=Kitasatospora purpeofusca TaxID=67352 RepID=UPI0035D89ED1